MPELYTMAAFCKCGSRCVVIDLSEGYARWLGFEWWQGHRDPGCGPVSDEDAEILWKRYVERGSDD